LVGERSLEILKFAGDALFTDSATIGRRRARCGTPECRFSPLFVDVLLC
jgi:hypothetical protein